MMRRRHPPAAQPALAAVRAWFALAARERLFVAGILAIFLVGLVARRAHLHRMAERPLPAPGTEIDVDGGRIP